MSVFLLPLDCRTGADSMTAKTVERIGQGILRIVNPKVGIMRESELEISSSPFAEPVPRMAADRIRIRSW